MGVNGFRKENAQAKGSAHSTQGSRTQWKEDGGTAELSKLHTIGAMDLIQPSVLNC